MLRDIPVEKIATATPVYVKNNVEFIVDTKHLGDWQDVKDDHIVGMTRSSTKQFYAESIDDELKSKRSSRLSQSDNNSY